MTPKYAASRRWMAKNPAAVRAERILANARQRKRVVPASACEKCGAAGRLDAHHPDNRKPLSVRWLCRACHREEHLVRLVFPADYTGETNCCHYCSHTWPVGAEFFHSAHQCRDCYRSRLRECARHRRGYRGHSPEVIS